MTRALYSLAALLFAVVFALQACATISPLEPTKVSPSSQGEVTLDKGDENENNYVEISVRHMAPPELLEEQQYTTYVVWLRPQGEESWNNIGQLKIDDDRVGTLRSPTPYHRFDVIVTAESRADATTPSTAVVLLGNVSEHS